MKPIQALKLSGKEVLPLVEGGKGISISTGITAGAFAAAGGVGTFSAVNADAYDHNGVLIPVVYHGKTRRERHHELLAYGVQGGIVQAQRAHDLAGGKGRIHLNVLWEMAGVETILHGVLEQTKGLVHGVTCGAGMPYRLAEIAAQYQIYYYPIVSSARAFRALWKRSYCKFQEWLGAVVYEDPWKAGGHNGLSRAENFEIPEDPYPRVRELRQTMNEAGLHHVPIVMAGGVWYLRDWEHWMDNPEIGPIAFQLGTRPLLTQESPISDQWKKRLLTLKEGDIFLNRFSPTGFYSSAVKNAFLENLRERSERQVAYTNESVGEHNTEFLYGPRQRTAFVTEPDFQRAQAWVKEGYTEVLKTPDNTLIFVTSEESQIILKDQRDCMGCLSACRFSNWLQEDPWSTGKKADPRSFCIQKSLQSIAHGGDVENELMFAGHGAYHFGQDPFYANGFIPTVKQLVERLVTGD
jgi:NAD(P)H-dependent flavin oxidoreductase YrpB (nitropropane dioxygenase family)